MRLAGKNEWRALLALALLIVPLSAMVNHLPVVVVFVPVILALARNTDLKASRLLIPLSYFSILGGTCTLIGMKTNLLVNGIAHRSGLVPFGMFEITPLGLIYAAVGSLIYLSLPANFCLIVRASRLSSAAECRGCFSLRR
jgi:di/tricarboxylate transporter